MAISRVEAAYHISSHYSRADVEQQLIATRRRLSNAAEHTFSASFLLLRQSNSLETIPDHDAVADAHVKAIRALAQRLPHIRSVNEAIEIAYSITRHCDGYDEADGKEDAEVHLVAVCNVDARTVVREANAEIDAGLHRQPKRTSSARGQAGKMS